MKDFLNGICDHFCFSLACCSSPLVGVPHTRKLRHGFFYKGSSHFYPADTQIYCTEDDTVHIIYSAIVPTQTNCFSCGGNHAPSNDRLIQTGGKHL